jgi:MFS family permease
MSLYQFAIIALCMLAYASDGLDVVALSYAAPGMLKEWGITATAFGVASTATPIGIAIGSFFLSPFADRIGRRPLMLAILGSLSAIMFLTATAVSLPILIGLRLLTGIAIGALVVCLNVTVNEYSNEKRSTLFVGILHMGYTVGSMVCGALAALIVAPYGWRSLFFAAGALNLLSFVLGIFLLAESPSFLLKKRSADALARLNAIFRRMGRPEYESLPEPASAASKAPGGKGIIPAALMFGTVMLCIAGFVFTVSGGFMAGWRPQVMTMAGFTMTQVGLIGAAASTAGIAAHFMAGALARAIGEVKIAVICLIGMIAAFIGMGAVPSGDYSAMLIASTLSGFFNLGVFTANTLVTLKYFDPENRNTGLGLMLGFSRVGGIFGPLAGGFVIGAGFDRFWVMFIFAVILALPIVAMLLVAPRLKRVTQRAT